MTLVVELAAVALESGLRWTALFAAAWLILRRSNLSAAARHHVWTVLLAGLLLLPVAVTVLPSFGVVRPALLAPGGDGARLARSEAVASAALPGSGEAGSEPFGPTRATPGPELPPTGPSPASAPVDGAIAGRGSPLDMLTVMWPWMWLGAMLGLLGFQVIGQLGVRSLGGQSVPAPPAQAALLRVCARRLGIRHSVRLRHSRQNLIPLTWGWLRPVVLLPAESVSWSPERLRRVLLHELAHVARSDSLLQSLARITCSVFWFHPAVWYAARCARREAELACDDRVLEVEGTPFGYVEDLLRIAHAHGPAPHAAALPMAGRSGLDQRVRALLASERRRGLSRWHAGLVATSAAAVVCGIAAIRWLDPEPRGGTLHDWLMPSALHDGRSAWSMDCASAGDAICTDGTRRAVALLERTGRTGAVVAQRVSSGEVVVYAAVTRPGSHRNAAVPSVEPGSLAKLALAALWWENGWVDSLVSCPPETQLPSGRLLRNAGGYGSDPLLAERMLVVSCNTAAIRMAERLIDHHGATVFTHALERMGFGAHAGIRTGAQGRQKVTVAGAAAPATVGAEEPGRSAAADDQLLLTGLGLDGSTTTPLQISHFLQAVGNDGRQLPVRHTRKRAAAAEPQQLIGHDAATRLQRAMQQVVLEGTGTRALPQLEWSRWTLSGKTGTVPRDTHDPDGWFAGLAHGPDGRAEYTIVVLIEGGGVGGGAPAGLAAEMTRLFARVRGDEL